MARKPRVEEYYHGFNPDGTPIWRLPDYLKQLCRAFRQSPTDAEQFLWQCLRARRLAGLKFRRQHAIGRYVVDFYCHEHRLIVELEGAVHEAKEQRAYDEVHFEWLEAHGYRVLRVRDEEFCIHPEQVLQRILALCSDKD